MTNITIPVADELLVSMNMDKEELAFSMRREFAARMYQRGMMSLSQGMSLCGMDIYEFMSFLSNTGIPVIDYEPEDLEKELAQFQI
jgi:predicted HTH domain antitoxin